LSEYPAKATGIIKYSVFSFLTAIFPGEPGLAGSLKLRMMEVVVKTGAIKRAKIYSTHNHQQTNTQCFTGRMPFLSPNQQCQSTEGNNITFQDLANPKLIWGSSDFVFDH